MTSNETYLIKVLVSALIIATVSEVAKRSSLIAAIIAFLPLTSILALVWLYLETSDPKAVATLSMGIFWMVLPSLDFFLILVFLLKYEWPFWGALFFSLWTYVCVVCTIQHDS